MKAITGIGIAFAFVALLLAVILEGGNPMSFLNIPALLIVGGGTLGAAIASTTFANAKRMPKLILLTMKGVEFDLNGAVRRMVGLAEKARRDGLLALEDDLKNLDDDYERRGLQLVVDGADSELVRNVLQSELDGMSGRHHTNAALFATAGGFAPTLGIIGTVMSLVHVLENLGDPSMLGHSIAGAFIATLYGVGSANLICLPVANKLKELSSQEVLYRELLLEAILSIQAGDNPRLLGEKLETFIPPSLRGVQEPTKAESAPAAAAAAAAAAEAAA